MMTAEETQTLTQLYNAVADPSSVTFSAFLRRLKRLQNESPGAWANLARELGIESPFPYEPKPRKPSMSMTQFVAYDGEGFGNKYVLFANSLGESQVDLEGLDSERCLEFLSRKYATPYKRVFFSFGYDVNHILKSIPDEIIEKILSGRVAEWKGYHITYIPGKIFSVNGIRYYDVFSFFARSFISVIEMMLGPDRVSQRMREGKSGRGEEINAENLQQTIEYNAEELLLMVEIMDKLRKAFHETNVNLTEWYGPGAVAKYWFRTHNILPAQETNPDVIMALNAAYFGGRFEQVALGHFKDIYEYDIHSAYPSVIATMPYFTGWSHHGSKYIDDQYSIWHVSFDFRESVKQNPVLGNFLPLPMRTKDGRICFPLVGKGWYWNSEIRLVLDFYPSAKIVFHEGYVAHTDGYPFGWVKELYDYRTQLKQDGNLAQYAIKVGLNSLYGKTAQRVGSNKYFSLAWAGFITSTARARLARVGYENDPNAVIGFATDAVFTDRRFSNINVSDKLGGFGEEHFDEATFFQSGIYRLVHDGKIDDRYRGSPMRRGINDIIAQIKTHPSEYPQIKIARFISHLLAIKAKVAYGPYRLRFINTVHKLQFDAPYKRHYIGFLQGTNKRYDWVLTRRIASLPKVWIDDNDPSLTNLYRDGILNFQNIESYPPPLKDGLLQLLIGEGDSLAESVDIEGDLPTVADDLA